MRTCGVLYPLFSLPSKYGIGSISREAYEFIDFLKEAGQGTWQILPVGPTGYGDSPYQPFSAFAGNPYFVDLETLIQDGLLDRGEVESVNWGSDPESVDYGALYQHRYEVLEKAYHRFTEKNGQERKEYRGFLEKERDWLEDYCLFMTIKQLNGGKCWQDWDEELREHKAEALENVERDYPDQIGLYRFIQYEFTRQWKKLHEYAKRNGIKIIGDMPFYVSLDSSDAWAHPEVFLMNEESVPTHVAGCAPDAFSATGQLWGNPLYDWETLKQEHYAWWIRRIQKNYDYYDVIRIDHFHGFHEYYAIPYGDLTAEHGELRKGPGMDFFHGVFAQLGKVDMIAEDLGTLTVENQKLLEDTGLPGMKVLEYAFTSWNSVYIPYRHIKNCVVYTGTHDNAPVRQWLEEINDGEREYLRRYLNSLNSDYGALTWDFIREAYRSVADLCVIPIQDYLVKGREARINTPGSALGNWCWRILPGFLSSDLARSMRLLSETYARVPEEETEEEQVAML